jgi:hypothetical protein
VKSEGRERVFFHDLETSKESEDDERKKNENEEREKEPS